MLKLFLIVFLTLNFSLVPFANAIDKESLKTFFVDYDSSIEKRDWNWERLPFAIEKGYIEVAEFLILKGDPIKNYRENLPTPDVKNSHDYYFKHPLLTAIRNNYTNLSILIIQLSKDVSKLEEYKDLFLKIPKIRKIFECKHALQLAIECPKSFEVVCALLVAGADVNMHYTCSFYNPPMESNKYFTPLKTAISLKKIDIIQLLLDYNVDVEFCGGHYISPLYMAVDDNYIEGVELLLSHGADPLKQVSSGLSPLELAMQKGYFDLVDLLLEAAIKKRNTATDS